MYAAFFVFESNGQCGMFGRHVNVAAEPLVVIKCELGSFGRDQPSG